MTFPIIYKNLIQTLLIQTLCVFSGRSSFFSLGGESLLPQIEKKKIILKPAVTLVSKLLSNTFKVPIYLQTTDILV